MNRAKVSYLVVSLCAACSSRAGNQHAGVCQPVSPLHDLPLPGAVPTSRQGTPHADPAFEPLPGARAEYGELGGAAYQIELPDHWNGRLVLWMHGFEDLAPQAQVAAPDFRRYLIGQGFAWGASSFTSTSQIPGIAADETAELWDHFVTTHGRPTRTYVAGLSMGGWATHIAAERYGDRFDGGLGLCGAAGTTPGIRISAEQFVVGAFVAGVTQAEYDSTTNINELIERRILPALEDPDAHQRFETILIDLTGGPRAFAREGIHAEEATNWRRSALLVGAGLVPGRDTPYRLAGDSGVSSEEFNERAIRLGTNEEASSSWWHGTEITGRLQIPLLTLQSTGDGQVPIDQAQILHDRVAAAGATSRLVQQVIEDPSHCGFSTAEQEAAFAALVDWVECNHQPAGTTVAGDLTRLDRTFELLPRPGTPAAEEVAGANQRVAVSGVATVDDVVFDARWLGAAVRVDGMVTPCQLALEPVVRGRYQITVLADAEASGCGRPGAEILLWTVAGEQTLHVTAPLAWPKTKSSATFSATFSSAAPRGAAPASFDLAGELYGSDGQHLPPGTRVEAYVGATRCAVTSARRTGNFGGYIMNVVGPDSIPGCIVGAPLRFRIDGHASDTAATNQVGQHGWRDLTVP